LLSRRQVEPEMLSSEDAAQCGFFGHLQILNYPPVVNQSDL
jgi:hypothetical protein